MSRSGAETGRKPRTGATKLTLSRFRVSTVRLHASNLEILFAFVSDFDIWISDFVSVVPRCDLIY
jgi:hypothetical protein